MFRVHEQVTTSINPDSDPVHQKFSVLFLRETIDEEAETTQKELLDVLNSYVSIWQEVVRLFILLYLPHNPHSLTLTIYISIDIFILNPCKTQFVWTLIWLIYLEFLILIHSFQFVSSCLFSFLCCGYVCCFLLSHLNHSVFDSKLGMSIFNNI